MCVHVCMHECRSVCVCVCLGDGKMEAPMSLTSSQGDSAVPPQQTASGAA